MTRRIAWQFYDPILDVLEDMEVNPNAGASPAYKKNFTKKTTTAPNGQGLIFQGQSDLPAFPFSGVILTENQYDFLKRAFDTTYPIEITDDLGRVWRVVIESFVPTRKVGRNFWRHDYSCEAVIVQ